MRVAVMVNELTIRGGTHKQVLRLCEFLKNQKVDFTLFTKELNYDLTYPEFGKFDIVSVKDVSTSDKGRQYAIFKLVKKAYDIVNIHDGGFEFLIILLKRFSKSKIVWQINDLPGTFDYRRNPGVELKVTNDNLLKKIKRKLFQRIGKRVEVITVNVTKNRKRVQACFDRDAEVLYCGVDFNTSLVVHEYLNDKKIRLLSTGVFFPFRNYETLLYVVRELKTIGYDVELKIIGATTWDKEYSAKIIAMISELEIQNNVFVLGQVNEKEYVSVYNDSEIFLFMNINQSWGLAVFEAMSCGLPVIVSDSVGAIELLHNNYDSIILSPSDVSGIVAAIVKLKNDFNFYNMISKNAVIAVSQYTWENMYCKKMLDIFKRLCVGGK